MACASCHHAAIGLAEQGNLGKQLYFDNNRTRCNNCHGGDAFIAGVQNHPNLDNPLRRNGSVRRLNFTDAEKQAMVAFLRTLSDEEMARDPKFSDPFRGR